MVPISYYLALSAVLFGLGVVGFVFKRNILTVFMSIELMLNAVNLAFVAFSRALGQVRGPGLRLFRDRGGGGGSGRGAGHRHRGRAQPAIAQRRTHQFAEALTANSCSCSNISGSFRCCRCWVRRPTAFSAAPGRAARSTRVALGTTGLAALATAELAREFARLDRCADSLDALLLHLDHGRQLPRRLCLAGGSADRWSCWGWSPAWAGSFTSIPSATWPTTPATAASSPT